MPYREKRIYSGNILEVEIYPISKIERKQKRKKKEKESMKKQKNLNDKNAKKHLIRLLNTNFTDKDLSVTLTYDKENLPSSEEEARKDVANYLRRIKTYRKKQGLEDLKYIAVVEYKEPGEGKKAIRLHHHIVISGMDRDIAEQLWKKGRANADRLKADEFGYEGLARYISKDPKGNKRWTQSRNLKQPIIKVNDYKYSGRKVYEIARGDKDILINNYTDYLLNDYKQEVNDITAGIHINIKMRKRVNIKS
ncbi:MAG: rolling circle replication-associated protein [Clostridium sp.]